MKVLIGFSGGKDSQACLIWAVRKYGVENCEAIFNDTQWEHPITYCHIKNICNQIGVKLTILKSKKYNGFSDTVRRHKIFPQAKIRFCTVELKIQPFIDYILTHDQNIIIIDGIRKQESARRFRMKSQESYFEGYFSERLKGKSIRSYRKKDVMAWCKKYKANLIRPIFNWTTRKVFKYIKDSGTSPNPLYSLGFNRVGCFPCFMSRKDETIKIIDYFPEEWERVSKLENEINNSFFTPRYIPEYARFSKTKKGVKICKAIDVENYLKSKFGYDMPKLFNLSKEEITSDSINQLAWISFKNEQETTITLYGHIINIQNETITWKEEFFPKEHEVKKETIKLFKIIKW